MAAIERTEVMPTDCAGDPRVQRTRRAVIEAVRELALTAGPAAVSHQAVAEHAGVGRATLYRHWPTRQDLLADALRPDGPLKRHPPTGDLRTDLVRALRRLRVALQRSTGTPMFLVLVGHADGDAAFADVRRELIAEGEADMRGVLEDAQATGRLDREVPVDILVAQLAGPIFYRRLVGGRPIPRALIDRVVDAVLGRSAP